MSRDTFRWLKRGQKTAGSHGEVIVELRVHDLTRLLQGEQIDIDVPWEREFNVVVRMTEKE